MFLLGLTMIVTTYTTAASLTSDYYVPEDTELTVTPLGGARLERTTTEGIVYSTAGSGGPTSSVRLYFSTELITNCIENSKTGNIYAYNGTIIVDYRPTAQNKPPTLYQCRIPLSVPTGHVVFIDLQNMTTPQCSNCGCLSFNLYVYDNLFPSTPLLSRPVCTGVSGVPVTLFSYSRSVTLVLSRNKSNLFFLQLAFSSVLESSRPKLEVVFTSSSTGYMQTPGWDTTRTYPDFMYSSMDVQVPKNHGVMLSGSAMELSWDQSAVCQYEYLMIVSGNSSAIWTGCQEPLPPTLLFLDVLKVVFKGLQASGRRGFRLLFSFHSFSSLPEKVSLTKWNCSVPFFFDFQQHLSCDLVAQCVGGEDEVNCPYTKEEMCGSGYIFAGEMCLIYIVPDKSYSWNEASEACMIRDLRLATLNTQRKWKEVTSLMNLKSSSRVYVGLTSSLSTLPHMYKDTAQWTDGSIAYFVNVLHSTTITRTRRMCAYLSRHLASGTDPSLLTYTLIACASSLQAGVLCEKPASLSQALPVQPVTLPSLVYKKADWSASFSHVTCSQGHVAHEFLACDTKSSCVLDGTDAETICPRVTLYQSFKTLTRYDGARPPMFECASGADDVPYTLVCDRRPDCKDRSDEDFCLFPTCPVRVAFPCSYDQCVPMGQYCDGLEQCLNGADEDSCEIKSLNRKDAETSFPAIVKVTGSGYFDIEIHPESGFACPPTHFRCPGDDVFCLPVFLRCNNVYDCPGYEDEARCDDYTCAGLYRCRGSRTCLHVTYLCDGVPQCPERDDELLCDSRCPTGCTCYGLAFFCRSAVVVGLYTNLRFLHARGVWLTPSDLLNNTMLVYLGLVSCHMTTLYGLNLPNLHHLDVSDNQIVFINSTHLSFLPRLRMLSVSGNPLTRTQFTDVGYASTFPSILMLDFSDVYMPVANLSALNAFPHLQVLNLSGCGVDLVAGDFQQLTNLRMLDVRACPLTTFVRDIFKGLDKLEEVKADNFKLCCQATLPPGFNPSNCLAPSDEVSSCDALLRSNVYRVFLSAICSLCFFGNFGSLAKRILSRKSRSSCGFQILVTNLCMSDLLMGMYLAIIGIADRCYYGTYLWSDTEWKTSVPCKVAGFVCLLSCEVSTLIMCLITLDRFLGLCFPLSRLKFNVLSAKISCIGAWVVGLLLAAIPLLPGSPYEEFYGQTGLCIPLPITRKKFSGHSYIFGLTVILNCFLVTLIAAGQLCIYWSIRSNAISFGETTKVSREQSIARRLAAVATSTFMCWLPIGLLGFLASRGVPIPGELGVALVIFVLPLNSALNPFLYTLSTVLERRRREREQRIVQQLLSKHVTPKMLPLKS